MKTTRKLFSPWFFLFAAIVLATATAVVADPQNYGIRAVRIRSLCTPGFPATPGLPEVPPPATVADPNCPSVPTLATSPSGRWSVDISWFDPSTQKFYMADRNNFSVDIVDANTDTVVGAASNFVGIRPGTNTSGPNGVLTTGNPRQLWAGDGDGTVKVYSLDANGLSPTLLKTVSAGGVKRADEMAFDPDDHVVLVAWDDDADLFLAFISVSSIAGNINVLGTIHMPETTGCGIEQPVYNHATNRFYLAVPCTSQVNVANHNGAIHANGEIAVINPLTMAIENVFALDGTNCFPHGLALGPRQNLLLGCSGDAPAGTQMKSIIMKATTGAILQTFTQLGGSDEVWYNRGDNHYYLAMSSWTSTGLTGGPSTPSLGIINAGSADTGPGAPVWVQNILTTRTSHSVAAVYATECDSGG
ncbi:MAG TPA: hypothetical protein VGA73_04300, partial [Candidatus Binatia bacterium]